MEDQNKNGRRPEQWDMSGGEDAEDYDQRDTTKKDKLNMPENEYPDIPLVPVKLDEKDGKRLIRPKMSWGDSPWRDKRKLLDQEFEKYVLEKYNFLDLDVVYNEQILKKHNLRGLTKVEFARKGLVKGLWKCMREVRSEVKRVGRQWLKINFYRKAGERCGIMYYEGGSWKEATKAKDVYKSWKNDWSDDNIKRHHLFWDHFLQSRLGWEEEILEYIIKELDLAWEEESFIGFENDNVVRTGTDGKVVKRRGPKRKNTWMEPFKRQVKDQRDYMRRSGKTNRDFKRFNGQKGHTGKRGTSLQACYKSIIDSNPILIPMNPGEAYSGDVAKK
jgi:hypothetical protein